MTERLPLLHAVTDDRVLALPDVRERLREICLGPEVAVHLRGRLDGAALLGVAETFRRITAEGNTRLLVNDRCDVARIVDADGVHLPALGLPVDAARRILGPTALIGRSAHTPSEARDALQPGADYVMLGPVWTTASHPDRPRLGLDTVREVASPGLVAVGGLTPERAAACRAAGIPAVAAVTALWDAQDPAAAAHRFLLSLRT